MQGTWIRKTDGPASVVFVHGILSSAETCWRHSNGTYWPDLLAQDEDLKPIGIYVFNYETGLFSGTYRLGDVVDALKEHMRLDGVLKSRRIVFVCHSMGGIVARRFVVQRASELIETGVSIAFFLIASPSLGADYANWLSPLAAILDHTQADVLRFQQTNSWLMDLDRDFQNLKESGRLPIRGKELVEDKFFVFRRLLRKQVVEPFSGARYFGEAFKVPNSDHFSIAKVEGGTAIQHRLLRQFILELEVDADRDKFQTTELAINGAASHLAANTLQASLTRLVRGQATIGDQISLQRAVFEGSLVMESAEQDGAAGKRTSNATILSGESRIPVDHGLNFGQKLREFLLPSRQGRLPPRPQLFLIGRSSALLEIKRRLGIPGGKPSHSRTIVRGWPGIGKTTLVNTLAYDAEIGDRFPDGVLWTSLPREPQILAALAAWGRAFGLEGLSRSPTVKDAVEQLSRRLADLRALIIIDDVWDAAHALPFLNAAGPRCGVLLTTRIPTVADELCETPDAIYKLPLLEESDGLTLLRVLAPDIVATKHRACLELVRDLECLPLALHVAGRLLTVEARLGWSVDDLLRRMRDGAAVIDAKAPADRADVENQTIPTVAALLQQSSELLENRTKDCFAFLGAFAPKPATFDLESMKAVWQIEDPKPIVRELTSRGLIEPVGGRFQMHALLVAHARSLLEP